MHRAWPGVQVIHFINVVWGAEFTETFLSASLPNTLSAGNLGAFADDPECRYRLYTTPRDAETIRASASFSLLASLVPTEIIEFDGLDTGDRYEELIRCHRDALLVARGEEAAVVFLAPDAFWSDGTFRRLRELDAAEVPLVMVAGVRVTKDTFLPDFLAHHFDPATRTAPISSRSLVELALTHLHSSAESLFWDASDFAGWPAHLYWRVPSATGFIQHAFHLQPLMLRRVPRNVTLDGVIDDAFVADACPDVNRIHIVTDSDEIAVCEMTEATGVRAVQPSEGPADEVRVVAWASITTNRHHRVFVRQPIFFHADDLGPEWGAIAKTSTDTVSRIVELFPHSAAILARMDLDNGNLGLALTQACAAFQESEDVGVRNAAISVAVDLGAGLSPSEMREVSTQIDRMPPEIADALLEAYCALHVDAAVLAGAITLGPRLAIPRALVWSTRLRQHGVAQYCPLMARAGNLDVLPGERLLAAGVARRAFEDPAAEALCLAAIGELDGTELDEALRNELALWAPDMLTLVDKARDTLRTTQDPAPGTP
jgi:hypothetical protein